MNVFHIFVSTFDDCVISTKICLIVGWSCTVDVLCFHFPLIPATVDFFIVLIFKACSVSESESSVGLP